MANRDVPTKFLSSLLKRVKDLAFSKSRDEIVSFGVIKRLASACGRVHIHDSELFSHLATMVKSQAARATVRDLATITSHFASFRVTDQNFYTFVAHAVPDYLSDLRPEDTLGLLKAYGSLRYHEMETLEALAGELRDRYVFFSTAQMISALHAIGDLGKEVREMYKPCVEGIV